MSELLLTTSLLQPAKLYPNKPALILHELPIREVMDGSYTNWDFTLTYGEVIHDYLGSD